MEQKINPIGFRLVVTKDWVSEWLVRSTDFSTILRQNIDVRNYLRKRLANVSVGYVVIKHPTKSVRITIHSVRPGVVISKKGEDTEILKHNSQALMGVPVHVNIEETHHPELGAQITADSITQQLEKRVQLRRIMKRTTQDAIRSGAKGIKIMTLGRLDGVDIARSGWYREGRAPLRTLRANIDYATSEAYTTYGILGLKVWVYTEGNIESFKPEYEKKQRKVGERNVVAN